MPIKFSLYVSLRTFHLNTIQVTKLYFEYTFQIAHIRVTVATRYSIDLYIAGCVFIQNLHYQVLHFQRYRWAHLFSPC